MRSTGFASLVVAAVALVGVCTCGGHAKGPGVATRDSAGVRIVQNGPLTGLGEALRISPTPLFDLGGDKGDPNEEIDPRAPLVRAARLSDGRYVVVSMDDLKLFAADGTFLGSLGGPGEGPGEFKQVGAMCLAPGDTIVASDLVRPDVAVFDSAGHLVRSFTDGERSHIVTNGCLPDGDLLVARNLQVDFGHDVFLHQELRHLSLRGEDLGVIDTVESGFANFFFETTSSVVVNGGDVYVGDGTRPEYRVYDETGTLERIVRWSVPAVVPTDAMLVEQVKRHMPRNVSPKMLDQMLARARATPLPPRVPVYFRLRVDGAGRVWVEDSPETGVYPRPWTVFDSSGVALGRVTLPAIPGADAEDIRSFGRDTVSLWWRDDSLGFAHLSYHVLRQVAGS